MSDATEVRENAWSVWWPPLALIAWMAAMLWWRPLMLPDEGRYVGVAWEMLRSGDWLTPTLNGLPFFHKPPLFYWITAAALHLFGNHQGVARAAPLLGAMVGALSIYLLARRWSTPRIARTTLLVLAVQPLFYLGGQFANLDMLVAGCITATTALLAHACLSLEAGLPYRRALLAAYAAAGLGFLAKGLIGVVLPSLIVLLFLTLVRRLRLVPKLLSLPGLLVLAAITVPWMALEEARYPGFIHYFIVVQHFQRFSGQGFNNAQPWWFYLALLGVAYGPWTPSLVTLARRGHIDAAEGGVLRVLMAAWVLVVLVFFTLPQSKLVGYILPLVVPLAFLVADAHVNLRWARWSGTRAWRTSLAVLMMLNIGVVTALSLHPRHTSEPIAVALQSARSPGEPIVMLNRYYYDLPFYADLRTPVTVVDNWDQAGIDRNDDWHRVMTDAAGFDPKLASSTLLTPVRVQALFDGDRPTWVVGPSGSEQRYPVLRGATVAARADGSVLWHLQSGTVASNGRANVSRPPWRVDGVSVNASPGRVEDPPRQTSPPTHSTGPAD